MKKFRQLREYMALDLTSAAPKSYTDPLQLPDGATWGQVISQRCVRMAAKGDMQAMRLIHDTVDLQTSLTVNVNAEATEREIIELRAMFRAKVEEAAAAQAQLANVIDVVPEEVKS